MFNYKEYNKKYLESNKVINDAEKYNVKIKTPSDLKYNDVYWKIIGIHHLLPNENVSKHNIYFDVLDEKGNRIPMVRIGWTWEGRRQHETANPITLDKPNNETGADIAMHIGQFISTWIASDKSDIVTGLNIMHPDEILPNGDKLNTYGHHSFYVVYQRSKVTNLIETPAVINPPVIENKTLEQRFLELESRVSKLEFINT